jgi:hypothetical protein
MFVAESIPREDPEEGSRVTSYDMVLWASTKKGGGGISPIRGILEGFYIVDHIIMPYS